MRLVMMGTGDFALPTFLALYSTCHEVVGLFTQPDRTGRGHHHHRNPLKEAALEHQTRVYQPENANTPESLDRLRNLKPDLCVVAAYGQILSDELLQIPRLGAINVHASLLPKYRGAAPVQFAVLNGDGQTGVTIFQIQPKLDAGPILAAASTAIGPKETAGEIEHRLSELSVPLVVRVIDQLERGNAEPLPQPFGGVTRAPRLKKSDGSVDWNQPAWKIDCHVRAMQPWPKAFTYWLSSGREAFRLIILDVEPASGESAALAPDASPGDVVLADGKRLLVQAADGPVDVRLLQPEGKRTMAAVEFLNGHAVQIGDRMGPLPE